MSLLAEDEWACIFAQCPLESIIAMSEICKLTRAVSQQESVWRALLQRDFPKSVSQLSDALVSRNIYIKAYWTRLAFLGGEERSTNPDNLDGDIKDDIYALHPLKNHWYKTSLRLPVPLTNFGCACHDGILYVGGGSSPETSDSYAWYRDIRQRDSQWVPLPEIPADSHVCFQVYTTMRITADGNYLVLQQWMSLLVLDLRLLPDTAWVRYRQENPMNHGGGLIGHRYWLLSRGEVQSVDIHTGDVTAHADIPELTFTPQPSPTAAVTAAVPSPSVALSASVAASVASDDFCVVPFISHSRPSCTQTSCATMPDSCPTARMFSVAAGSFSSSSASSAVDFTGQTSVRPQRSWCTSHSAPSCEIVIWRLSPNKRQLQTCDIL
eukprot:TRINITY_DN11341_c0_g1_i1.p1 TRINITY_DN11341_c0_g1~~TRINITY_DN11341_c0_g1_i1.p1  ORF type:complete len:381 (+),score=62.32 TRINITY_DN11341_c0_g1_i1:34-1176(+)